MIRPFLTFALVAGTALPAPATESSAEAAAQSAGNETLAETQSYSFRLADTIKTLDPQTSTEAGDADIIRQLFEGLLNADATGAPVPGVATGFDLSADRLTYTFHLRADAKWSNGEPVTAGDFVYAWRRLGDPATGSHSAGFIEMMHVENASAVVKGRKPPGDLGVRAVDDRTLEVRLTTPTPYFPKLVTHGPSFPVNRKAVEAGDGWTRPGKLVGNGAYVLKGHEPGLRIDLEKNSEYWDAADVVMAHVQGQIVNDTAAALARYQAGGLDRVQVPAGQFPQLRERFPDQAVALPRACTYAYLFNMGENGPRALKDARVRKALSYAMPRDEVVNRILQGGQRPAYGWTHWAVEGFRMPEIAYAGWPESRRLEQARALLAEAGYGPEKPLKLSLTYNTDEHHKQIATAARQGLKQVGVELTLKDAGWKAHAERLQTGDFELARYTWCADYNDASSFLDHFRSDGRNYGQYDSPEFDRLLEQAKTSPDPAVQYTAAERLLAEDMPLIPIYHYAGAEMIRDDIRGLPTGNAMNDWYAKDIHRIRK